VSSGNAVVSIEAARRSYLPSGGVEVLFIAEAPPADPRRFFYFERVLAHDSLYLSLMRALFEEAIDLDAVELRHRKPEFLERFKASRYYLLDASDAPMPAKASPSKKRRVLTAALPRLIEKVREVAADDTRIVLISSTVHSACCASLTAAGFNVVNMEAIDFPSSGRQREFFRKLGRALDEELHRIIRALEASVRFFAADENSKRVRERYVVEHFLRSIGLTFEADEIVRPDRDPPDATFRGAAFEVKEVQREGRRRHEEYKARLAKARAASSAAELLEHFSPESIAIGDVYLRIMDDTRALATTTYRSAATRRSLDLLYYFNLDMETSWGIDDGARPSIAPLITEGWRSVSFLQGSRTACVIAAGSTAPGFLTAVEGVLMGESDLPDSE
jgi:Putative endonuclease, protein of unknown function (DUF1780)